jgi:hypothetical protein
VNVNSRAKYYKVRLHQDNIEITAAEVGFERTEWRWDGQALHPCKFYNLATTHERHSPIYRGVIRYSRQYRRRSISLDVN